MNWHELARAEPPSMNPDSPFRPRFQFRLSYLIYLLTVIALALAILRRLFDIGGGWQLNLVFVVYLAALTAYFSLRFPFLLRRLWQGRQRIAAQQASRQQFLDQARGRGRSDG